MINEEKNAQFNIQKIVSYRSQPRNSIKWDQLKRCFTRLDKLQFDSINWERISEIHIIGSKKEDEEIEIEKEFWGEYLYDGYLICIYDYRTESIPWISNLSTKLQLLDIRFLNIKELDLSNIVGIRKLVLSNNPLLSNVKGYERNKYIFELNLSYTSIDSIPCLNYFPKLKSIRIRKTKVSKLELVAEMEKLRFMDISSTLIKDVLFLEKCPNLLMLSVYDLEVDDLSVIDKLSKIEFLNCSKTKIINVPPVGGSLNLRSLNISYTNINSLEGTEFPNSLKTLNLAGTGIVTIPESISLLRRLRRLVLNELHLKSLPTSILELCLDFYLDDKGYGINLFNTIIDDMDISIFGQPRDIIESWFVNKDTQDKSIEKSLAEPLNEAKVVFLGDGGAGKSLTIKRLINDCEEQPDFVGEATPGIAIEDMYYAIKDKKILVHYWDFGGQEIMHSMHRMFLTQRTLYVVFINARDNTQDERARYWLHNIKSFANKSPVIIIINQIDQNPNASVNEPSLRVLYPELKEIIKISAKYYSKESFRVKLQMSIINELENLPIINEPFLSSWKLLKYKLQNMKEYYIDKNKYYSICSECKVEDNSNLRSQLLDWFTDLGVSFCYQDSIDLSNYMILRPDWMTNAIYIILFNCASVSKNGVISHEDIYKLLGDKNVGKRVLKGVSYSTQEVSYVLGVIRKFHLSYRIDDRFEFIPMLCNRNEDSVAQFFYGSELILEYQLQYQYLPLNVIHRLMVDLRHDLNRTHVWLTGALFESSQMGYRALVKAEDNYLRIYVEANNKLFHASSYLGFIRSIVNEINSSLGLSPVEKIIYKENDIWDEFDYEYIIDSFEHGNKTVYSSKLKKNLYIEDILNQTDGNDYKQKEQLLNDVTEACMMLQANKIYWNSSEDERNTLIRDILRSKKYNCADQTFTGKSQTGKKAGEVDIEIFETPSKHMALIEALNIDGFTKNNVDNWNRHLQKLIDNYNPIGLPVVFLVTYLKCSKDAFKEVWMNYFKHAKSFSCGAYALQKASEYIMDKSFYCRIAECQYDRAGMPITAYHIFVRIGE